MKTYEAPLVRKEPKVNYEFERCYACHYEVFDKEDRSRSLTTFGACHSNVLYNGDLVKENYLLCYVFVKHSQYSLEDIKRYLRFLGTLGFKISYVGIKEKKFECEYVKNKNDEGKAYIFRFDVKNYLNRLQIFAAVTAFRYIFYTYSEYFTNIPERTFELKKIYGRRLQNLQAIILAYYTLGAHETGHAFIGCREDVHLPKLKCFNEQLLKKNSINGTIQTSKRLTNSRLLKTSYFNKQYKELAELIKIKYKE